MLFHSSIRRELAQSFGATLVVLFTIVVIMLLIRTLSQATAGGVDPKEIMLVLGYLALGRLPVILTMALFMAVVSVLSRMYRDSEMVIWMGSGRGTAALLGPIIRFAWPVLLTIGVLVLLTWPWANQQTADLRDRFAQRSDLKRVAPGQFQEGASGQRVFFIDKDTANGTVGRNVFISSRDERAESTISAQAARIGEVDNEPFLFLSTGQRLETSADRQLTKVSEFGEYASRISEDTLPITPENTMKTRWTWDLVGNAEPAAQAELGWRIGLLLSAGNLMLLALATSSGNPRAGRSGNVAFALFAFLLYYNLLNLGQSWMTNGKTSLWPFMFGLHGSAFLLTMLWLFKRHVNFSFRAIWRQARTRNLNNTREMPTKVNT